MYLALAELKDHGHPSYQDIMLKCPYCPEVFEDGQIDIEDHVNECQQRYCEEGDNIEDKEDGKDNSETEVNTNEVQDQLVNGVSNDKAKKLDISEHDNTTALSSVQKYQAFNDVSCIVHDFPEANIVVNTEDSPKEVLAKDSIKDDKVVLAPGEGKIPSNVMRKIGFDINAFPGLYPSGKFGLHFLREIRISKQQFFKCRLFHYSGKFANDPDFVFMAQQFVERAALESQIDISMQKGIMVDGPGHVKSMKLLDAFSVFQKVPGTPKYWQQKRNNLLAMINALGPFQIFFTFSCAELRWSVIISCILRKRGHVVVQKKKKWYIDKNDPMDDEITVDGLSLNEYLSKTGQTLREIIMSETFLVTRMFDQRVKKFVKYVLMERGPKGLKLKDFMYRVEFQGRGAPHIHGCAWIKDDVMKSFLEPGTFNYKISELPKLINKFISCKLPENEELRKVVEDLQTHSCTKSCRKKGPTCRFGYPRLPSDETIIAIPLDKENQEDKRKIELSDQILQKMNVHI